MIPTTICQFGYQVNYEIWSRFSLYTNMKLCVWAGFHLLLLFEPCNAHVPAVNISVHVCYVIDDTVANIVSKLPITGIQLNL